MRAGECTVHQALTPEAASTVKQAVALARRRGHAQVTPLHVATTMLSSPTGLLRSSCLQSNSHPLQCKALELCFNVALNRLPASSSSPILSGPHHHHHLHHPPSLSNALVAAFKRAQAHQRRGSIESQQQPLLAVKIELEQLIISILDDPSVSRVMREAGFNSTQVKSNVEKVVSSSSEIAQTSNPNLTPNPNPNPSKANKPSRSEDVLSIVDELASGRKRSLVVVGECLESIEVVVRGVMDRVEKGEVPEVLRSLQFITLPLISFRSLGREEVEQKVGELKCLVKNCCVGPRGAVLYLGDLKWVTDYRASSGFGEKGRGYSYYCPIEHVIMEIRSLVNCDNGVISNNNGGKFWVMGIANYPTYMRCRVGSPPLEAVLGLHPLTIPSGSLELSLNCESDSQSMFKSKTSADGPRASWPLLDEDGERNQLTCCGDCSLKFETEARCLHKVSCSSQRSMITSTLPSWLQKYKDENKNKRATSSHKEALQHLCKKWNSTCNSTHQPYSSEITLHFSSTASPTSSSISSYGSQRTLQHHLCRPETVNEQLRFYYRGSQRLNLPSNPNSTSSGDTMEMEYAPKFKELNAENLKILCNALERKVPWQKAIIPEIASTILQCRSGMMRRKEGSKMVTNKEDTWMFFQGSDVESKEKIARELASLVFGSYARFVSVELISFSSTRSDSTDDCLRNKRSILEASHNYLERFFEAVQENPHRVFLVQDVEHVDSHSQMGIKAAMEKGRFQSSNGEEVNIADAIIILSCESLESRSRACSPPVKQKLESEEVKVQGETENMETGVCLDLNLSVADEDNIAEECSLDGVGFLESVDRTFFFKLPEDL